jgi:hypothetical protein
VIGYLLVPQGDPVRASDEGLLREFCELVRRRRRRRRSRRARADLLDSPDPGGSEPSSGTLMQQQMREVHRVALSELWTLLRGGVP